MLLLLLNNGDIERNPGPVNNFNYTDLSILHCNIRSLRQKLEYMIFYVSLKHLDMTVPDEFLHLSNSLDKLYRKDRTNHGGGICVYLSSSLLHQRVMELETFCEESIWISITFKRGKLLIGTFYSPKTSDSLFFEKINKNIEKAYEITHNIVILGDLNEDLFNPNFRKLKDILNINSLQNVISEPTRWNALLDPILVPNDMQYLDSGILPNPPEVTDHCATYITLAFPYDTKPIYEERCISTVRLIFIFYVQAFRLLTGMFFSMALLTKHVNFLLNNFLHLLMLAFLCKKLQFALTISHGLMAS